MVRCQSYRYSCCAINKFSFNQSTEEGLKQAREAATMMKEHQLTEFGCAFTSCFRRAIKTLWIALEELDLMYIPIQQSWHMNERMYGKLSGLSKSECANQFGEEQVKLWRRAYDVRPPPLPIDNKDHPIHDKKFKHLSQDQIPSTECLKDVVDRVIPFYESTILPKLKNENVLVVAHGSSIRALIKHLDKVSDKDIEEMDVPTAIPLLYQFDESMNVLSSKYLAPEEVVRAAQEAIKNQGKKTAK
eukprot:TRINITY_DN6431_c0_g1_i2.p1 TRINITY_DN6431_c0_g1~~TRINITY_DN6431_c0_g1_i2.p1  ORF type:complete len:245 (-),score=33.36 TRINITY_DN6431_c0_g1_i2:121-855(-)